MDEQTMQNKIDNGWIYLCQNVHLYNFTIVKTKSSMDLLGSNEIEVALNNNQSGLLGEIGLNFSEIASIIYQDDFEHKHYQDGILSNTKTLDLDSWDR